MATVNGEAVLTDLCQTAEFLGLPTTGMQKLLETGEDTAEEGGGTAGDTVGTSSTKWWTEREEERKCYDKEQPEGLSKNMCIPPSSE